MSDLNEGSLKKELDEFQSVLYLVGKNNPKLQSAM